MAPIEMTVRARLVATIASATDMLLATLDSDITSTAMPPVDAASADLELYGGVLAGDALSSTTAMPLFGRLSDIYGCKRLYLGGIVLFVLASAAGAGSTSTLALLSRADGSRVGDATVLEPAVATQFRVALVAAMHDIFLLALVVAGLGIVATVGMARWQKRGPPWLTNPSPPVECRCA